MVALENSEPSEPPHQRTVLNAVQNEVCEALTRSIPYKGTPEQLSQPIDKALTERPLSQSLVLMMPPAA